MKTIMIIEDNPDTGFLISEILEDFGYQTALEEDGKVAVEEFDEIKPNLVLSDVGLPGMSGLQVLEKLKSDNKKLPVVIMSGSEDIYNELEAIRLGAYDYIQKPFDNEHLLRTIEKAMNYVN
ncbi:MAG: response regulator [Candidatus Cloacimonetes bacterium]|nr:response regulator [Candidatus Cloacimonadota bacterium]